MRKLTFLAVAEKTRDGYGVFYPDLPGCISFGDNIEEVEKNAKEALELHIYGMEKDGDAIPTPSQVVDKEYIQEDCIVLVISVFPDMVKNMLDSKRVKTNTTIPQWLKDMGEKQGANYSQLLEYALMEYLGVSQQKKN
jgi:Uncharacterized conserved protein